MTRPASTMVPAQASQKIFDALIIGGGPAGLSAALALARVCRSALVFDSGEYRNAGVKALHTFLSRDGTPPGEFRAISRGQIEQSYPHISFRQTSVLRLWHEEDTDAGEAYFGAADADEQVYTGRKLVLATGTEDILPTDIPGYKENWPSHIYQCLFCDGFEQRDYPIGVLSFAAPSYAHLALMARQFNEDVTIYSNGPVPGDEATQAALRMARASGVKLDERRVASLVNNGDGPARGVTVTFDDAGPDATVGMLLHRPATRNRAHDLIAQLGLETNPSTGDVVVVNPMFSEASVPGCIVAGDTMDSLKQVAVAVGTGVRAGAVVAFQLCNEEGKRALSRRQAKPHA